MTKFSILDLARIVDGGSIEQSFKDCVRTAQTAETLGYNRVWYAEHHNMMSVASSATSVLIAHIAAHTKSIRLGRIDLGLGRAPGGDRDVIRALRKDGPAAANRFPQDVMELLALLDAPNPDAPLSVRAVPGEGTKVPVWILGSSLFGAQLAAHLGLPYAFASHFAPQHLLQAANVYREQFKPSKYLDKPYFIMACNVFAADTEDEAQFHFSTLIQAFIGIITNQRGLIPAPVEGFKVPIELAPHVESMLAGSAVGDPNQVAARMQSFQKAVKPDEYIISMPFYDQSAREHSMALTMGIRDRI